MSFQHIIAKKGPCMYIWEDTCSSFSNNAIMYYYYYYDNSLTITSANFKFVIHVTSKPSPVGYVI